MLMFAQGPRSGVRVGVACALMGLFGSAAHAQLSYRALRPSEHTIGSLNRTLGRLSNRNATGGGYFDKPVATASPDPTNLSSWRRPSGMSRSPGFRTLPQPFGDLPTHGMGPGRQALFGRRFTPVADPTFVAMGGRLPATPEYSRERPGLLLRPSASSGGETAEPVAVRRDVQLTTTAPASEDAPQIAPPQVTVADLVSNYVQSRRQAYLDAGWERFKAGQYREALDQFSLADGVTTDDAAARAEVRAAMIAAAVAAQQPLRAVTSLGWLLTDDPRTGQFRGENFLEHLSKLSERYGKPEDFTEHVRFVEHLANVSGTTESQALRAVMLWSRGDRTNAMFYAREILKGEKQQPWTRLIGLMEATERREALSSGDPSPLPVVSSTMK
jgi:hypothetical protein